jgi:pentatricopeptide repeat protein
MEWFEFLLSSPHVQKNESLFCCAIKACGFIERWQYALDLLQIMPKHGVIPSISTYNTLLATLGKYGQWKSALHLMHTEMPRAGIMYDAYTYVSVRIYACVCGL